MFTDRVFKPDGSRKSGAGVPSRLQTDSGPVSSLRSTQSHLLQDGVSNLSCGLYVHPSVYTTHLSPYLLVFIIYY